MRVSQRYRNFKQLIVNEKTEKKKMKKYFITLFAVAGLAVAAQAQVLQGTSCTTKDGKDGELRVTGARSVETNSTGYSSTSSKDSGKWSVSASATAGGETNGVVSKGNASASVGGGYNSGGKSNASTRTNSGTSSVEYDYDCFPKKSERSGRYLK